MNLTDIGRANFTEKANLGFLDIYEEHWKPLYWQDEHLNDRNPITLLEIGVYNGNSIKTWLDWFRPTDKIVGIDKHPAPYVHDISAAKIYTGDQADIEFLKKVVEAEGPFDIIIDDGGHHWDEQQVSFDYLWPHIKPGGMYIIEDLQTSGDVHWRGQGGIRTSEVLAYEARYLMEDENDRHRAWSMHIYPRLCILKKKK